MRTLFPIIAAIMSGAVVGCTARTDLVGSGFLTLEPQLTSAFLDAPSVYDEDGSLLVDGRLNDPEARRGGHVDVTVIAPDGAVVYDAQVNFRRHVTGSTSRRRGRVAQYTSRTHYHYSVRFPGLPPEGSTVRVRLDLEPHDAQRLP